MLYISIQTAAPMSGLARDNAAARAMGLSYGDYKAMLYEQGRGGKKPVPVRKVRPSRKRFDDRDAFLLWQQGKSDGAIARSLGVSRQVIQRWRDVMELPATATNPIDTGAYQLLVTHRGTFAVRGVGQ